MGSLLVAATFVGIDGHRRKQAGASVADSGAKEGWFQRATARMKEPVTADEAKASEALIAETVRGCVIAAVVAAGVLLIATPIYLSQMAALGGAAAKSASVYTSALAIFRFALLVVGTALLGIFAYRLAGAGSSERRRMTALVTVSFFLVLIGELCGRALFYETMIRVGI